LNPLGLGFGDAGEGNYAAQNLKIVVTPVSKTASRTIFPDDSFAFLDVNPSGSNNTVRFTAVSPGDDGNDVSVTYQYTQKPSITESVSVSGNDITVTLGTNSGSAISSTANSIVTLVNANGPASALVIASLPPSASGSGTIGSRWPKTYLTNTRTKILYTAVNAGSAGENIRIRYVDPSANSQPLDVTVSSNDITVSLETNGSGDLISTAADIISAVNTDTSANLLVTAEQPGVNPVDGVVAAMSYQRLWEGAGPNLRRSTTLRLSLQRSDDVAVLRDVVFNANDTPDTEVLITTTQAYLLVTPSGTTNSTLLLTANDGGTEGNDLKICYVAPIAPASPLSVSYDSDEKLITLSLATDQNARVITTADEAMIALNADGTVGALVTATIPEFGHGYLAEYEATNLANGADTERYFGLLSASVVSGGEGGDVYTVKSIPERSISM
jgi:hypothetical protein